MASELLSLRLSRATEQRASSERWGASSATGGWNPRCGICPLSRQHRLGATAARRQARGPGVDESSKRMRFTCCAWPALLGPLLALAWTSGSRTCPCPKRMATGRASTPSWPPWPSSCPRLGGDGTGRPGLRRPGFIDRLQLWAGTGSALQGQRQWMLPGLPGTGGETQGPDSPARPRSGQRWKARVGSSRMPVGAKPVW